ncbi:DUF4177 domain-containing protein [Neptunicoccus cionae]|uniref:Cell division protein FtsZ n=1 Tax=Neptunicoccus cionae TaxID=2035344 RepID=A0A916QSD5_9RHOB|nr:DUF4177 domain-containing protein [Amylibacter cionae]GGA08174.1 cell division protein FtsZ [Amylibacter cionae]
MQRYEYKAVPAPNRPKKVKGVKTTAGRFAAVLTDTINDLAKEGWEYLRSDSMPVEEKPGLLKSRVETYQTILVFRRALAAEAAPVGAVAPATPADDTDPEVAAPPASVAAPSRAPVTQDSANDPAPSKPKDPEDEPRLSKGWGEGKEDRHPKDPPMRGKKDESPFAEPTDKDKEIDR